MKERKIIEEWDGPVCVDDRYFDDLDSAVQYYWDDAFDCGEQKYNPEAVPEFVECCDEEGPRAPRAGHVIESMDDYPENCHSDDNYASNAVTPELVNELQAFLDEWAARIPWRCWQGNGKYIKLRPLVEEYEKEDHHRQMMHQAMDYAGT